MLKTFREKNTELILHYYAFDWDDNLLFMPTTIIVRDDNNLDVGMGTDEFARYRSILGIENFEFNGHTIVGYPQNEDGIINYDKAFKNFRDITDPNVFIDDTKQAILNKLFAPSWFDFIECLTTGALFAIITARGHESHTIRTSVEYIIDTYLTNKQKELMYNNLLKYSYLFNVDNKYDRFHKDELTSNNLVEDYLDMCEYIGVSAPSRCDNKTAVNPEKAKRDALLEFKSKINKMVGNIGMKARIGFSDDDTKTVKVMEDLFRELDHEKFPNIIEWSVKNTNDPNFITKKVIKK